MAKATRNKPTAVIYSGTLELSEVEVATLVVVLRQVDGSLSGPRANIDWILEALEVLAPGATGGPKYQVPHPYSIKADGFVMLS
jgi:hypothetical protein